MEPYDRPYVEATEALVIFAAAEREDEPVATEVAAMAAREVAKLAGQLKVDNVVIVPFAHLFVDLAVPEVALGMLKSMALQLEDRAFSVQRVPFGWFNTLEIRAKGHPLSRIARTVRL